MDTEFAQNLKDFREKANLTQSQLANDLGVTQRKISYWETGKFEPNLSELVKISKFFQVSLNDLLGLTDI